MLTYKSYYNIAPTYLCELISRKESYVNTRFGADHHHLLMPEDQILIHSERVLKQYYLHNSMDADRKQFIYYCYLCCNHC